MRRSWGSRAACRVKRSCWAISGMLGSSCRYEILYLSSNSCTRHQHSTRHQQKIHLFKRRENTLARSMTFLMTALRGICGCI